MKKQIAAVLLLLLVASFATGCRRKIDGPRVWWDDQAREQLPDSYQLPEDRREGTERDPKMQNLERYGIRE